MFQVTYVRSFACACLTGSLLVGLSGCASFQTMPPQQFHVRDSKQAVRVVESNGTELTLEGARVSGDTLYGTPTRDHGGVVAIPFNGIYSVAVREKDGEKTAVAFSGIALLVGVVAIALTSASR